MIRAIYYVCWKWSGRVRFVGSGLAGSGFNGLGLVFKLDIQMLPSPHAFHQAESVCAQVCCGDDPQILHWPLASSLHFVVNSNLLVNFRISYVLSEALGT